jgi:hypothetical protein
MKLTTLALASAFALSSTLALAATSHHKHKSGAKTHTAGQSKNYGRYYGNPNNRGGLVGGDDSGTYGQNQYYGNRGGWGGGPYSGSYGQSQYYGNRGGWGGGPYSGSYGQSQYYGSPNNRGGLVGGDDSGTR